MATDRFDALSRAVAAAQSRRAALSRVVGVGLALAATGNADTAAAKKKRRKKKKKKPGCAGAGQQLCNDVCVNLLTDPANCGACGTACIRNECIHGACGCQGEIDCPAICGCAARKGGGAACLGSLTNDPCESDDDCPVGAFCLVDNRCSIACLE